MKKASASLSNDDKHATDALDQLKSGTTLVKRKNNGKQFARQFYLHEHEGFVSYQKSRKLFGQPRVCK
jgi:hypothetical protein